jgi:CHRD domain
MVEPRRFRAKFAVSLLLAISAIAQKPEAYKVRLTPVSMDAAMKVTIAGSGSASATLTGATLMVTGAFDGLLSPATTARIHRGSVTGVRGPVILDLTISPATVGTFSGTFALTPDQVESLHKGRLYIQIGSEKAPDGNLWGWLLA